MVDPQPNDRWAETNTRVKWCKLKLQKFSKSCSKLTREVLTGDKTGIYWYDLQTKCCYHFSWWTDKQLWQLLRTGACITVSWKTFKLPCLCRPNMGLHGLFLHHENASQHTTTAMVSFLTVNEAQLLLHFLYTPDLSTCGFFLFPRVEKQLQGSLLGNKWFHSMALCIAAEGMFFEEEEKYFFVGRVQSVTSIWKPLEWP